MNEKNNFALVPRPPGALEKVQPGAKRILSSMITDTLALVKKASSAKPTFTALLGRDQFADVMEMWLASKLGETHDLRFFYFSRSSELIKLAEEHSFDFVFVYLWNINWDTGSEDGSFNRAAGVLGELSARYGKTIVASQGMDLSAEFEPKGVLFLTAPFILDDVWARLQPQLAASVDSKDAVTFPRKAGQGDQTGKTRPPRIVVVDDESSCLEMFTLLIRNWFKDVTLLEFSNSGDAWHELLRTNPDLLVLDMPLTGVEILPLLAERKVKYPIFLTSGLYGEKEIQQNASPNLRISCLSKPFSPEQFYHELLTHIGPSDNPQRKVWKNES